MGAAVRVLLVEDNPWHQELVRRSLEDLAGATPLIPHEVTICGTLGDALERLVGAEYDVVLLDLELPDADGIHGVRSLRTAEPGVPIIVLTGTSDEELALLALRAGAQDYLIKGSVDAALLRRAIRYAIERRSAEELVARSRWLAGIGETVLAMQHEINNPLAVLLANAELLGTEISPADEREMVDAIVDSAWRIAGVVQELSELRSPRSVPYLAGRRMLDLSQGREEDGSDPNL